MAALKETISYTQNVLTETVLTSTTLHTESTNILYWYEYSLKYIIAIPDNHPSNLNILANSILEQLLGLNPMTKLGWKTVKRTRNKKFFMCILQKTIEAKWGGSFSLPNNSQQVLQLSMYMYMTCPFAVVEQGKRWRKILLHHLWSRGGTIYVCQNLAPSFPWASRSSSRRCAARPWWGGCSCTPWSGTRTQTA